MNTKEQFIAFLEANGIEFEEVGNQILLDFQGVNFVASNLATVKKKNFQIGIPFVWKDTENATNSDKELIRQYLDRKTNKASGCTFSESVENNLDGSFSPEAFRQAIMKLASRDYNEELSKLIGVPFAMIDSFGELLKSAFSVCTKMLEGFTDVIESQEK